jgi:D-beta-D-heptose 7-phosphate kinase/D-beta-D-heptose 1-phosphate adenosyltransferase
MDIHEILDKASKLKIAVVGDFIKDEYIFGDVERISPEAPVPVVKVTGRKTNWGGAGNVVKNLEALGVEVDFYFDKNRNIVKTRVMSDHHHLIRIDEETIPEVEINCDWMKDLEFCINSKLYDCVVISDYHKGVVIKDLAQMIIKSCANQNIPVVVDAKKDFHKFKGATVLKSNKKEYLELLKHAPSFPDTRVWLNVDYHVVTLGEQGISLFYENDGEGFDGYKINTVDVCGAGDTVTAILAICMAGTFDQRNIIHGCELANIAASEVCQHSGVYPITKEDLIRRVFEVKKL